MIYSEKKIRSMLMAGRYEGCTPVAAGTNTAGAINATLENPGTGKLIALVTQIMAKSSPVGIATSLPQRLYHARGLAGGAYAGKGRPKDSARSAEGSECTIRGRTASDYSAATPITGTLGPNYGGSILIGPGLSAVGLGTPGVDDFIHDPEVVRPGGALAIAGNHQSTAGALFCFSWIEIPLSFFEENEEEIWNVLREMRGM